MKEFSAQTRNGIQKSKRLEECFNYFKILFQQMPLILSSQMALGIIVHFLPVLYSILFARILEDFETGTNIALWLIFMLSGGFMFSSTWFNEVIDSIFRYHASAVMQEQIHLKGSKIPCVIYDTAVYNEDIDRAKNAFCYGPAISFLFLTLNLISTVIAWIGSLVMCASYHPFIIISMFFYPISAYYQLRINQKALEDSKSFAHERREMEDIRSYLTEYSKIKETLVRGLASSLIDKHSVVFEKLAIKRKEIKDRQIVSQLIASLGEDLFYGLSIGLCAYLAYKKQISVFQITAVIMLIKTMKSNSQILISSLVDLNNASESIHQGWQMLNIPDDEGEKNVKLPTDMVKMENVSFRYPNSDYDAIKNCSLTLRKGQLIALVGENGAGKTTLCNLLLGLYKPSDGHVYHGSVEISAIHPENRYLTSTVLFQDFNHYGMSLAENISFTSEMSDPLQRQIQNNLPFVERLEKKEQTLLMKDFGGTELSGGQWQEVALNRAIYKQGEVVVLDEPTSAIDPLREEELLHVFSSLVQGKIGIIVTHRLPATLLADSIIVMNQGEICEYGTREELLNQSGLYAKMWNAQKSLYKNRIDEIENIAERRSCRHHE